MEEAEGGSRHAASFWESVWIIVVADITMSLDNVLAVAAAAHGDMLLVSLGIALSLPIVVWGSGILATLMNRFIWIIWIGGGILGYVAGEMIMEDAMLIRWLDGARYADTNGYQSDGPRDMWRWRDWVIDAFNRNMPFDRFTVEQIAGEALRAGEIIRRLRDFVARGESDAATSGLREYTRLIFGSEGLVSTIVPMRDGLAVTLKR